MVKITNKKWNPIWDEKLSKIEEEKVIIKTEEKEIKKPLKKVKKSKSIVEDKKTKNIQNIEEKVVKNQSNDDSLEQINNSEYIISQVIIDDNVQSIQTICNKYLLSTDNFKIYYNNELIWERKYSEIIPIFNDNHFILWDKIYMYKGFRIKR